MSELLATPDERIAWFKERNVRRLAEALGLDTGKIVRSSEPDAEGQSTELLIELTRAVGGTAYRPGADAYRYQEDDKFHARGIELVPQAFVHPTYPQAVDPFVPGLSIVDALMSCGFAATPELVSRRSRAARSAR